MDFQVLISAVGKDKDSLLESLKLSSDGVIVNQCEENSEETFEYNGHRITWIKRAERGVGLSRNTALKASGADICLFGDEDLNYYEGYKEKVLNAFNKFPDAAVITFNFEVDERRRTYFNEDIHEIKWNNYGRYPAYAIAVRRKDIVSNNICYSTLFGGGAKYSNGEDSLFLHDCLKAGLKMMAVTDVLGREEYRESTWFKGYTDKFFFDRGVLYHFLYGRMAQVLGFRFLFKNRKTMCTETGLFKAFGLLRNGINEGKTL